MNDGSPTKPPRKRRPLSLCRLEAAGHISATERKILAYTRMGLFSQEHISRCLFGVERGAPIHTAPQAAAIFMPVLGGRTEEALAVALLSRVGEYLEHRILTTGCAGATVFDAAQILRYALSNDRCAAIVVAHNHPSGNASPSQQDRCAVKGLKLACDAVGIRLNDSIIVVPGGGYSSAVQLGEI